jgi:hypothetical protein
MGDRPRKPPPGDRPRKPPPSAYDALQARLHVVWFVLGLLTGIVLMLVIRSAGA